LIPGISEVAEVAEMITGIHNGLETYQYGVTGVMGHNSIPPLRISPQDPKEDVRDQWYLVQVCGV